MFLFFFNFFGYILSHCFCFSVEVQSILNLSPPQDAELMNTNPSPPVSLFSHQKISLHSLALTLAKGLEQDEWHFHSSAWLNHLGVQRGCLAQLTWRALFDTAQPDPADQLGPVVQPVGQAQ